ncbi:hypothetical protein QFC20_003155 [Naganishia adeliensis]|uniref:Uncharacterized protein n=1 Tax=Naganishia adeliensis TaxID=92952 RepID=A0ACC2WF48_9TREE|nr:hypothetical protein QFC20_003155 [Naganishia adeliensis]
MSDAQVPKIDFAPSQGQATVNLLPYLLLLPLGYLIYNLVFPTIRKDLSTPPTSHTESYNYLPPTHPSCSLFRKYTPKELSVFDGKGLDKDGKPTKILLAIERRTKKREEDGAVIEVREERTVFDVSAGRSFYGPVYAAELAALCSADGPYGNFAGRDASRGMAMQSFEEEMLTSLDKPLDSLENLSKSEIDNMNGWHSHFSNKYIICGELIEDPEFASNT